MSKDIVHMTLFDWPILEEGFGDRVVQRNQPMYFLKGRIAADRLLQNLNFYALNYNNEIQTTHHFCRKADLCGASD
jgi:hypothetical protein